MIPRLRLFAGPNGAGKTTLTHTIKNEYDISLGEYINPDEIALTLSEIDDELERFKKAQQSAKGKRTELVDNKLSMTYESVMSHPSHLEFVKKANKNGFRSYLYYVGIAMPEICIDRVAARVQDGGHDVPLNKIESRYNRSLAHLYEMCKLMRRVYLFDNTGDKHVFIAEINTHGELCLFLNEIKSVGGAPWLKSLINQWDKNMIKKRPHAP